MIKNHKLLISACGKNFFLLALISSFFLHSCAQSMHGIKNARAFYQQQFTGTVAVDDNGNQITPGTDTIRWIYLETKGIEQPVIDTASFYGHLFTTSITLVTTHPVHLGKKKDSEDQVAISPTKGYTLWKIELHPTGLLDNNKDKIRIMGRKDGKKYDSVIEQVIELEAELRG